MIRLLHQGLMVILLAIPLLAVSAEAPSPETLQRQGDEHHRRGEFSAALQAWEQAGERYRKAGDSAAYIRLTVNSAETYARIGRVNDALPLLQGGQSLGIRFGQEHFDLKEHVAVLEGNAVSVRHRRLQIRHHITAKEGKQGTLVFDLEQDVYGADGAAG